MPETPTAASPDFTIVKGYHVTVQVPPEHVDDLMLEILTVDPLQYGFYDQVAFTTAPGSQQFRSIAGGQNAAMDLAVTVDCCELSFALPHDATILQDVLQVIYDAHPYEEPVLFFTEAHFTRHTPGTGLSAASKFWNLDEPPDWLPPEPRD